MIWSAFWLAVQTNTRNIKHVSARPCKNPRADLFFGRAVMISPDGFDRRQRRKQRLFFCVRNLDGCFAALFSSVQKISIFRVTAS